MGHDLTRMLLAGMPADWTTGERLVALVLADHCSDRTHTGHMTGAQLLEETGLGEQGIRRCLASLRARGYEFRVPVTTGSDGRLVYTNRGRATDYRVPIIPPRPEKARETDRLTARKARETDRLLKTKGNQSRPEGNQSEAERPAEIDCPYHQQPPYHQETEAAVVTPTDGRQPGGSAPRLPIEQLAWTASQRRRMLCATTTSTPKISGTTTSERSSA